MKAIKLWLVAVCTVIAFTLTTAAQSSNPTTQQTVDVTSQTGLQTSGGNNDTGGFAAGATSARVKAFGPTTVNGLAQTDGMATTHQTNTATTATSASNVKMGSLGSGNGATVSTDNNVVVQQRNWAGKSSNDTNLINAGNVTGADASGKGDAHGALTAKAAGDAKGDTTVQLNNAGANNPSFSGATQGNSNALTTGNAQCLIGPPTIASNAKGSGALNAQVTTGDPKGTFAGTMAQGTAAYDVKNPTGPSASGTLQIESNGGANTTGTTASAHSTITATSTGTKH